MDIKTELNVLRGLYPKNDDESEEEYKDFIDCMLSDLIIDESGDDEIDFDYTTELR